jgi:hypothetical protein
MLGIEVVLYLQIKVSSKVCLIRTSRQTAHVAINIHLALGKN